MPKVKHNMSGTRLYNIWRHVKKRCRLPSSANYQYYGGRGINVCDEWFDSFEVFMLWSLGNGYEESLSIDRKDVDGNYEPSNCRWANQTLQMKNRRNVIAKMNQQSEDIDCPF